MQTEAALPLKSCIQSPNFPRFSFSFFGYFQFAFLSRPHPLPPTCCILDSGFLNGVQGPLSALAPCLRPSPSCHPVLIQSQPLGGGVRSHPSCSRACNGLATRAAKLTDFHLRCPHSLSGSFLLPHLSSVLDALTVPTVLVSDKHTRSLSN